MSWELALPGWALRVIQIARMRPYPDPRVIEVEPAGGGGTDVDFYVHIANYETQQCRCDLSARVGDDPVPCSPGIADLIPNEPPKLVRVLAPRPQLGELVPQFNNTTTLYDRTLRVEVKVGKRKRSMEWHEEVYTVEADSERYGIQQRVWRRRRGEETEHDLRMELIEKHEEEQDRQMRRGPVKRTPKWYDDSGDIRDKQF